MNDVQPKVYPIRYKGRIIAHSLNSRDFIFKKLAQAVKEHINKDNQNSTTTV